MWMIAYVCNTYFVRNKNKMFHDVYQRLANLEVSEIEKLAISKQFWASSGF